MSVMCDVSQVEMWPCTPLALVASAVHSAKALLSSSLVEKRLMLVKEPAASQSRKA